MEFEFYQFGTLKYYNYAEILAFYKGKWIFCKHKKRTTWETPGGHIELGETPLEAAKRELHEETGAVDFDIEPLCDYTGTGELHGVDLSGTGQVYLAIVHTLGELPSSSEMEQVQLLDNPSGELTYPKFIDGVLPIIYCRDDRLGRPPLK